MTQNNTPQTPEAIAYQLMEQILKGEGKIIIGSSPYAQSVAHSYPSRQEILDTYKQCIQIVKNSPETS